MATKRTPTEGSEDGGQSRFKRDPRADEALTALQKRMQREGIFREMKARGHLEESSEKKARETAEAIARARKLARKSQLYLLKPSAPKPTKRRPQTDKPKVATKGDLVLEASTPDYASLETTGISGGIDEGLLNKSIGELLTSWGIPDEMHFELAAELERFAKARAKAALRPKWEERGKYAELKDLSAPQFLKRVYADDIAPDGSIKKATVRKTDPALMSIVEAYISGREGRGRDMGDAEGLRFVTSNAGRPKRAEHG